MRKRLQQLVVVAFVAFVVWQLARHPHSPAVFIHTYRSHK